MKKEIIAFGAGAILVAAGFTVTPDTEAEIVKLNDNTIRETATVTRDIDVNVLAAEYNEYVSICSYQLSTRNAQFDAYRDAGVVIPKLNEFNLE